MSIVNFINKLRKEGELIEIEKFVNPELEISEIVDRISKSNYNKAILFKNTGTDFPVLINAFGSEKRIALALGFTSLKDLEKNIESFFSLLKSPESIIDKVKVLKQLNKISNLLPQKIKKRGKCQEIIEYNPDLTKLPVLKCWPYDGGRFITLPMVHTIDPISGNLNVGMYRMQIFSANTTGMHWHIHKTGALHYEHYKKMGKKIPIAVALGGDPVYTYCATAPLPEDVNEYILAGILRKKPVRLVKCITQDIYVPEDVDIVIEGYVDPSEPMIIEGPFGDHTGFYSLPDYYPVFHVTAITYAKNAVYPATLVGIPPQEDYWFIKATERIFLPLIKKTLLPEIIDMNMPDVGVAHNLVLVHIKKRYPGHSYKVAHALWGIGQMMLNKILIISDTEISSYKKILFSICKLKNWKERILLSYGPLDVLEHGSLKSLEGGKLMFDATEINVEAFENNILIFKNFVIENNDVFLMNYGIIVIYATGTNISEEVTINYLLQYVSDLEELRIFILDKSTQDLNVDLKIWHFLSNFDPSLDVSIKNIFNKTIFVFDGRTKKRGNRPVPNPIIMDDTTINKIDSNWKEYINIPFILSPSNKMKHLVNGNGYMRV